MTRRAIIADVASKTTKTADVVVVVVSRVPPPHLVAPVPLGRRDNAIASPVRWLLLTSAVMMAVAMCGTMIVAVFVAAIIAANASGNHRAGDPSKALVKASDA